MRSEPPGDGAELGQVGTLSGVVEGAQDGSGGAQLSPTGATSPTVQSEAPKPVERRSWWARTFLKGG
jgi:hypothetical protein